MRFQERFLSVVIGFLLAPIACGGFWTDADVTEKRDVEAGSQPDLTNTESVAGSGSSAIDAKVTFVGEYLQLSSAVRMRIRRQFEYPQGDLYIRLCEDSSCLHVITAKRVAQDVIVNGLGVDVQDQDMPSGSYYVQFVLDRFDYSLLPSGDRWQETGAPGEFDLVSSQLGPSAGFNPPPTALFVDLQENEEKDLGEVNLGHIVLTSQGPAVEPEADGHVGVVSEYEGYYSALRLIDLQTIALVGTSGDTSDPEPAFFAADNIPFVGDICGMVKSSQGTWYVLALDELGTSIFIFDPEILAQSVNGAYAHIDNLQTFPCRGKEVKLDGKTFLVLINRRNRTAEPGVTVVDVTDIARDNPAPVVEYNGSADGPAALENSPLSDIAVLDDQVFLLEPNSAKNDGRNAVWIAHLTQAGTLEFESDPLSADVVPSEACGGTAVPLPAMTIADTGSIPHLYVANDTSITVWNLQEPRRHLDFDAIRPGIQDLDISLMGRVCTSFALHPDGNSLFCSPNCPSSIAFQFGCGSSENRQPEVRHNLVVLDVSGSTPRLSSEFMDDIDGDSLADPGLNFTYADLYGYLDSFGLLCGQSLLTTSYTMPQIAVSRNHVFVRGTGHLYDEESNSSNSGLGTSADLGVFNISEHRGYEFRNFIFWLDGPDGRLGFPLSEESTERDIATNFIAYFP